MSHNRRSTTYEPTLVMAHMARDLRKSVWAVRAVRVRCVRREEVFWNLLATIYDVWKRKIAKCVSGTGQAAEVRGSYIRADRHAFMSCRLKAQARFTAIRRFLVISTMWERPCRKSSLGRPY